MLDKLITASSIIVVALVLGLPIWWFWEHMWAVAVFSGVVVFALIGHGAVCWLWLRFVEFKRAPTRDEYWAEFNRGE